MSQNMDALKKANRIRYARADLKKEILKGTKSVIDVLKDPPECTVTMSMMELLRSQNRWGPRRVRQFLNSVSIHEKKTVGHLTHRQRQLMIKKL